MRWPDDSRRDVLGSVEFARGRYLRVRLPLAGQIHNSIRLVKTLKSLMPGTHAAGLPVMV